MYKDINVLAIVVTYNRSHMLPGCLTAIQKQTVPCHILVVDNASTDDTQEVLRPFLDDKTFTWRAEKNLGGAGGFHVGMRLGVQKGYQYLWIMDDDAYPEPTALEALLDAGAQVGTYGFLCSSVLWTDGTSCRMNRQKISAGWADHLNLMQHGIVAVDQATFVSCLFPAKIVRDVGLPIADFFIWGDDVEYTRRIAVRHVLPCYLAGKSIVIHHMVQNTGSDISTDSPERLDRYAFAYRNENFLYRQEGLKGVLFYCAKCGLHLLRIWARAKDHRLKRSWIVIASFFRGWFFRPQIQYIAEE